MAPSVPVTDIPNTAGAPVKQPDVIDLVLWKDPVKSGLVLSTITGAYVVLEWTSWSLISTLAIVAQFAVVTSFLWSFFATFLNRPGPPVPRILREGVSDGQVKRAVEETTPFLNKGLAVAYRLATGKDFVLTVQAVVALYIISKLGAIFSVITWLYLVVLAAFSVPKLYELKKVEIDGAIKTATDKSKQLYDTHAAPLLAAIPRASSSTSTKSAKADLSATADSFRSTVENAVLETSDGDKKAV